MSFTFAVRPFPRSDELGLRSDGFLERGTSMRFRISVLAGKPAADENERVFTADNVTRPRKRSAAYLHGKFNSRRKGQYLHDVRNILGISRPSPLTCISECGINPFI